MDSIKNKIHLLRKKLQNKGLYDSRLLALILVGFVSVSVFWSGAKIVQQNYELAQKVQKIEEENELLELENRNKELQNEYLGTNEFAELTARRVFGKAAPGERVYIVPKDVALNSLQEKPQPEAIESEIEKPKYQKNLEAWLNIYFGN